MDKKLGTIFQKAESGRIQQGADTEEDRSRGWGDTSAFPKQIGPV
jgi:hypothetical protein